MLARSVFVLDTPLSEYLCGVKPHDAMTLALVSFLLIGPHCSPANPGTIPLQSVQLYEAVRGNGGTKRCRAENHSTG